LIACRTLLDWAAHDHKHPPTFQRGNFAEAFKNQKKKTQSNGGFRERGEAHRPRLVVQASPRPQPRGKLSSYQATLGGTAWENNMGPHRARIASHKRMEHKLTVQNKGNRETKPSAMNGSSCEQARVARISPIENAASRYDCGYKDAPGPFRQKPVSLPQPKTHLPLRFAAANPPLNPAAQIGIYGPAAMTWAFRIRQDVGNSFHDTAVGFANMFRETTADSLFHW